MAKKCIICNEEANFKIKDSNEFYCDECAKEHFSDLSFLVKIEEEAQRLKEVIKEKMDDVQNN
ncbi:hypothetical protein ACFLZB_05080 [Nanoarchaeota archaeon]